MKSKKTINDVKNFWNNNPLFTGENNDLENPSFFFKKHNETVYKIFLGKKNILDKIYFPIDDLEIKKKVLDLGCGIGFWSEFMQDNFNYDLYASDISEVSINIAKKRVKKSVHFNIQKSERLNYVNSFFDHINCQGVLHHTTNPLYFLDEINRILKSKGTCSISIYYKNFLLKNFNFLYYIFLPFKFLLKNLGRGRSFAHLPKDPNELVKLYDGRNNPVGFCLDKKEFIELIESKNFIIQSIAFFYFPSRFLILKLPKFVIKILLYFFPFMMVINAKKNNNI